MIGDYIYNISATSAECFLSLHAPTALHKCSHPIIATSLRNMRLVCNIPSQYEACQQQSKVFTAALQYHKRSTQASVPCRVIGKGLLPFSEHLLQMRAVWLNMVCSRLGCSCRSFHIHLHAPTLGIAYEDLIKLKGASSQ